MRADKFLAVQGYYESRAKARAAIEAGMVCADGQVIKKPSVKLSLDMKITADHPHPWVSRAGLKLAHALEVFIVDPTGRTCLDVGASTGGFTQVLRHEGASKVYAVDVGRGQLHKSLKTDPSIISMESTDARNLTPEHFDKPYDLIVCDVSFISCMKALKIPLTLATNPADLITLIKPQFEVGKAGIGKGGIVRDRVLTLDAIARVKQWLTDQGWQVVADDISPIKGGAGNTEYLLHARRD